MMKTFEVKENKIIYGIGLFIIGMGICFLILEILFHVNKIPVWVYVTIFLICLSGVPLCMQGINRKLEIHKDNICYINLMKKKKEFKLQEIGYVKARMNPAKGQDCMILYDKKGKRLCKLEFQMQNAFLFFRYLRDHGITIECPDHTEGLLRQIMHQEQELVENIPKITAKVYEDTTSLIESWQEDYKKIGAKMKYGFAQYHYNKRNDKLQIQEKSSRCNWKAGESVPEDYLCLLEIYVKKDDYYIIDKKNKLLVFHIPIIYMNETDVSEERYQLYYNRNYKEEIEDILEMLSEYLPRHKFKQEQMELDYELMKVL